MSLVKIEKYNETFIRVFAGSSIEQELSDFFRFRPPGYQYMPLFKNKLWDGWTRLYNTQTKTIYYGLLDYVIEFCKRNNYELVYDSDLIVNHNITQEEVLKFTSELNLYARSKPITIHDYQVNAITVALNKARTLLISPTSSGKSLIIYSMIRYHLHYNRRCLVVVPSTSLVEQLYSDFEDYSSHNGFCVSDHMQKLYSGLSKSFNKQVLITTWQSIVNMPRPFFNDFDVIIGDEAHTFAAKSLTSIMEKLSNTAYRVGTTGTLHDSKVNKLTLEGIFGRVYDVTTTKELMDRGKVAPLKISCLILKHDKESRELLKKASYQNEISWLVSNQPRNKFIRNLAVSTTGNTLVLFQLVDKHGKFLFDMIKSKVQDGRKVFFVHGGVDTDDREYIRKICEHETNAIIVASYGTLSTGVNMPSIQNIIFASPYKSKVKVLQSIGRGLRLKDGKDHCKLFDIMDDLCINSWKNHTFNHATERLKLYTQQQFDYKMIEVELNGT